MLDSRRVLAPAPKVLGPKHISNPDVAPFFLYYDGAYAYALSDLFTPLRLHGNAHTHTHTRTVLSAHAQETSRATCPRSGASQFGWLSRSWSWRGTCTCSSANQVAVKQSSAAVLAEVVGKQSSAAVLAEVAGKQSLSFKIDRHSMPQSEL